MSQTSARVLDLQDYRRRRAQRGQSPAAARVPVVWVPVWVWIPVWS